MTTQPRGEKTHKARPEGARAASGSGARGVSAHRGAVAGHAALGWPGGRRD